LFELVEKRAKASEILKRVCCQSFRATGVTEYMNSGATIEFALIETSPLVDLCAANLFY
jgi:hypothetical protein